MVAAQSGEGWTISPSNSARYAPYVRVFEAFDSRALVRRYVESYPLFQRAYEELGVTQDSFVTIGLPNGIAWFEAAIAVWKLGATVETPIRRQLLCIRRDFDRLARLAKQHAWTDDTPVPPDAFGPLWPNNLIPEWAKDSPAA